MPFLISSARGTVHAVAAASRHALWYLDWRTGGGTARHSAA
jgi:hypothetical protein